MPADPPVAVPGPASERDPDDAYEDLERADHIDALCYELVESDQVPPDVLAPIQSYAVWLRNRARESERCRYKPGCDCGYCAAQDALAALPAVGERDKAEIEAGQLNADVVADVHGLRDRLADWVIGDGTMISLRDVLDELCRILDPTVPPAGERDRQQIARLTEALKQIAVEIRPGTLAASLSADQHVAALWEVVRHYSATARAVLAGEEDARPNVVKDNAPTGGLELMGLLGRAAGEGDT